MAHYKGWIICLDVAGGWTVSLQVLSKIPTLGLIKNGEEQGEHLYSQLPSISRVQCIRLADNQRPNKTGVQVFLLE